MSGKSITAKQKMFAHEYIIDLNATKAYQNVYKCSEHTARKNASKLLTNTDNKNIQEYIQFLMSKRAEKLEITADKVIAEIAKLAFANTTDILEITDHGVVIKDLSKLDTTCISSAEEVYDKEGMRIGVKVKLHDKTKNLELLGRHLGLFKDKIEHSFDEKVENWLRGGK